MKTKRVFILMILLVSPAFFGIFISTAQATTINTSFSDISVTPKTAALGQEVTITATISPPPPAGYAYHGIAVNVIDINGNYRNIGTNKTQTGTGIFRFSWTPDIRGSYQCTINYPGETLVDTVYTTCQSKDSFFVDPSLPTPTPTPTPLVTPEPTPTPTPTSISTSKLETSLNVNCQSSTTYSNFRVNVQGTLMETASNLGLSDSPIQLSYSVDGGNSWIPLTFLSTDGAGAFQAVWTPLVTGNYFLRAIYEGNSELAPASTIVHFAVLPVEETSVFSVASNSTVTALAFNSTSQELSFKVSGETGTAGYVNVYISKSLMSDASKLRIYFDQELLQPLTKSIGDSWLVSFSYHHSAHTIELALNSGAPNIQTATGNLEYIIAGMVGVILAIVAVIVFLKIRANHKNL